MPDITDVRQEPAFIPMKNKTYEKGSIFGYLSKMKYALVLLAIALISTSSSCRKDNNTQNTEDIPNVPVSLTINMDLPQHIELQQIGHWKYFDGGSRGIVVYHSLDDQFLAYDRNCSYKPLDACATLEVEDNNLYLRCGETVLDTFKKCCGSRFELSSGFPIQEPANRVLKVYNVSRSGNTLFVNN